MENKPIINNTILVKLTNTELVRTLFRKKQTATRAEIASETGLSVATCGTILNEMLASDEIYVDKMEESNGGRPARRFKYNKDFIQVACIAISYDLYIKTMHYIVANALGEIIEEENREYDIIDFNTVSTAVEPIMNKYPNIKSLIISIPGESYDGKVRFCDIKELQDAPLEKEFKRIYNINVTVDGIAQVAAYGYYNSTPELYGKTVAVLMAPRDLHLGAGIIVNGQLTKGDTHLAGEVSFIATNNISREEVLKKMPNREFLINSMVTALTAIISVINPSRIVIYGSAANENMYESLYTKCHKIIPSVFMPELSIISDFDEYFKNGLIKLAIESTTTGLKLINQTF